MEAPRFQIALKLYLKLDEFMTMHKFYPQAFTVFSVTRK